MLKSWSTENAFPADLDYTDPTRKYKNVKWQEPNSGHSAICPWAADLSKTVELCWACGWNTRNQASSYGPRIRVIHTRRNMGIWTLGSRYIVRDEPNDRWLGNHYITMKFLLKQPDLAIPLPEEIRSLSQPTDPIYLTLESRVPGELLLGVFHKLSQEEKESYAHQIADVIRQLRRFTAPRMQKVDGSQLNDVIIGRCGGGPSGSCFKIPYTIDEWFDRLGPDLRMGLSKTYKTTEPVVIEEKFQEVKAEFPGGGPYVLTHGDLNFANIIVKDGKIQGIIDWEMAGYYPWWYERLASYHWTNDKGVRKFYDLIWAEVEPEIDQDKYTELVEHKRGPAVAAFNAHIHRHPQTGYWRIPTYWYPSYYNAKGAQAVQTEMLFYGADWGLPTKSCDLDLEEPEEKALLASYKRRDPNAPEHEKNS